MVETKHPYQVQCLLSDVVASFADRVLVLTIEPLHCGFYIFLGNTQTWILIRACQTKQLNNIWTLTRSMMLARLVLNHVHVFKATCWNKCTQSTCNIQREWNALGSKQSVHACIPIVKFLYYILNLICLNGTNKQMLLEVRIQCWYLILLDETYVACSKRTLNCV